MIKKTEIKLDEVKCPKVADFVNFEGLKMPTYPSSEIMHFIKDLKSLEDRYGEMTYISKLNRAKFNKLQETEHREIESYLHCQAKISSSF